MKVQRPNSPTAPETAGVDDVAHEGAEAKGDFASKLEKTRAGGAPASSPAQATKAAGGVADIVADLEVGNCTKAQAVERVVERLLDKRLGPQAPTEIRAQVATALRDALADDPLLAAKLAQLD